MVNPMFLHSCLWFLGEAFNNDIGSFVSENRQSIQDQLGSFVHEKLDVVQLDLEETAHIYPAIDMTDATERRDNLRQEFFQKVLSQCEKPREVYMTQSFPKLWEGKSLKRLLPNLELINRFMFLTLLPDAADFAAAQRENESCLRVIESTSEKESTVNFQGATKPLALDVHVNEETVDLSRYLKGNIHSLQLLRPTKMTGKVIAGERIEHKVSLSELTLRNLQIDESVLRVLAEGIQDERLPSLSSLDIDQCEGLTGKLSELFCCQWPGLQALLLRNTSLSAQDFVPLSKAETLLPALSSMALCLGDQVDGTYLEHDSTGENVYRQKKRELSQPLASLLEHPWPKIQNLELQELSKDQCRALIAAINQEKFPSLGKLTLSMWKFFDINKKVQIPIEEVTTEEGQFVVFKQTEEIDPLEPIHINTLSDLALHGFVCSQKHLRTVAHTAKLSEVFKLDISHSTNIGGKLFILTTQKLTFLKCLTLRDSGLLPVDLSNLAKAKEAGKLPMLKSLDISRNERLNGHLDKLFDHGAKWQELEVLNVEQDPPRDHDFQKIVARVKSGCLRSLRELAFSVQQSPCIAERDEDENYQWQEMRRLVIFPEAVGTRRVLQSVTEAVERGILPKLTEVTTRTENPWSTQKSTEFMGRAANVLQDTLTGFNAIHASGKPKAQKDRELSNLVLDGIQGMMRSQSDPDYGYDRARLRRELRAYQNPFQALAEESRREIGEQDMADGIAFIKAMFPGQFTQGLWTEEALRQRMSQMDFSALSANLSDNLLSTFSTVVNPPDVDDDEGDDGGKTTPPTMYDLKYRLRRMGVRYYTY